MYAYRFDDKQNLLLKTKVMRATSFRRRENGIYLSYAAGSTLDFLACSTLQGPGHGIGDFFAGLDPARNPLREIGGFPRKCIPTSDVNR